MGKPILECRQLKAAIYMSQVMPGDTDDLQCTEGEYAVSVQNENDTNDVILHVEFDADIGGEIRKLALSTSFSLADLVSIALVGRKPEGR